METTDSRRRLPGAGPTLVERVRAWVISSLLMAAGAIVLVLAVMFSVMALAVAVVLGLALVAAGFVAFLVLRYRWRKRFGPGGDPRGGDRQNVRVIVHPPG
jgi:hypothetical protein